MKIDIDKLNEAELIDRRCPDRSCRFESVVMNIMLPS